MRPPKIALVSDAVLPFNKGGKETRIYHLTQGLVALGYQVDIYTMRWWQHGPTYMHDGVTFHALCKKYPLYTGERRSIRQGIFFSLSCLKLLRYSFDILEVDHMPLFPLFTTKIVSLIKKRPLYATWHEVWGKTYWQQYLGTYKGWLAAYIEKLSVKLPAHIIAVSEHTQTGLRNQLHYSGPISLVRNGIDQHKITELVSSKHKSDIIYAGRLLAHKHVDVLIEAVGQLVKKDRRLRCIIIGDGPEFSHLQQLITQRRMQANVQLLGFLESSDAVLSYMKSSKVFVLPSTREGFGISVLEAFACGLRVVTVDHPDNAARYLVEPGKGSVVLPTAAALSQAIELQLSLPSVKKRPRTGMLEYDWSQSATALKEVYAL